MAGFQVIQGPIEPDPRVDGTGGIRPDDIDEWKLGFGKAEVEEAARNLLWFFRERRGWGDFTIPELLDFYRANNLDPRFMFFGLMGGWEHEEFGPAAPMENWREAPVYLAVDVFGQYHVTDLFLKACLRQNLPAEVGT